MNAAAQAQAWLASDDSIGPGNTDVSFLDFTLVFENSVLSILPAACLLLIVFPLHVWRYSRPPKVASAGRLYWARLITALAMVALEVARSVVWCNGRFPNQSLPTLSSTSLASAVLGPASALMLLVMMHVEYFHAIYSSSVLGMWLLTTLLLDSARTRSFWLRSAFAPVGQLSLVIVIVEIVFLALQEIPKTLNDVSDKDWFGEAKAGFLSRALLLWINKFMLRGYRTQLKTSSLGQLGPDFSAEALTARFEKNWAATPDRKAKHALAWALFKTFKWAFLAGLIPQLIFTIAMFTLPLLIQQILNFMANPIQQSPVAAALLGAAIVTNVTHGVFFGSVTYYMNRFATFLRATLVVQLAKKDLRLGMAEARTAASVGLMTADVESIVQSFQYMLDIIIMIPEIALALYLLWTYVGQSFFLTLLQLALGWFASWQIGKRNGPAYATWNKGIQDRVSEASAAISQMKGIRMIGLDKVVGGYLQSLREEEVHHSFAARVLKVAFYVVYILQLWSSFLVLLVGGLYWTIWRGGLNPVTFWPALSYNRLISSSFYMMTEVYPTVLSLLACIGRIQDFLNSAEQEDKRHILATIPSESDEKDSCAGSAAIRLSGACVEARDNSHLVLEDVSFDVPTSTLSLVVGPVGGGKTVLLKAILGEALLSKGEIQLTSARVGFCDQTPWLPCLSIRDVVVGETPWDESRYNEVVDACALRYDIDQFPSGDATIVGSNGSGLSGGQKQRIALARAVYSLTPIIVCDDVLSALDSETSTAIFRDVFSSTGIIKRQGRTAIMATHSVQWLESADQVLVVKEGKVSILTDEQEIIKYSKTAVLSAHDVQAEEVPHETLDKLKTELEFALASQGTRATDNGLYAFMLQAVPTIIVILFYAAIAIMALSESFPEIYMRIWMQQDATNKLYIIGMGVLTVATSVSNMGGAWLYQMVLMPIVSKSLHAIFVNKVMSATLPFISATNSGILLNRFSQDMTLIGQELPMNLFGAFYSGCMSVIAVVVVVSSAKYATICIPVLLFMMWFLQHFYLRTSRQVRLLDLESRTPLYSIMNETQAGVETIRGLGWQEQTIKKSLKLVDNSQIPFYYMFIIQRWLYIVLSLMGSVLAIILTAMALYITDTANQAAIGLGLSQAIHFTMATVKFIQRWTKLETSLGAIARLRTFVEETPSESDDGRKPAPDNWPSQGAIACKDVSVRYSSEPDAPVVLHNISLQIEAGEKVVIVGRTGSGKSTMILTLLNFLDMTGSITIDGLNISTVPRHQLRRAMTTLPQDSIETSGTIRENLLPFNMEEKLEKLKAIEGSDSEATVAEKSEKGSASEGDRTAELEAVLEKVHLLEVIKKKGGLDAAAKDLHLSSGQRQLFNLARAILHKRDTGSKVVLMDEVTSHMDFETDQTIQAVLDSEFGECTRIIISHRATGYASCDKLVTMQDGKIVSVKAMKRAASSTEEEIAPVEKTG